MWLDKVYHGFLWLCGFKEGEHITDMLRRQKIRLGGWWWFFPVTTIALALSFLGFLIWLILHVLAKKE